MTYRITDDCIECLGCLEACPQQAIACALGQDATPGVAIDPARCTHCWPFEPRPRCAAVCPVDCIVIDAERPVPQMYLLRHELEQLLHIAGPFETARTIAQLRCAIREQFAANLCSGAGAVDADAILDLYNFLSLLQTEFEAADGEIGFSAQPAPTNKAPVR